MPFANRIDTPASPPTGLLRRLAAAVYDGLLVVALMMLITFLMVALRNGEPIAPGDPILQVLLLVTCASFFVGFWANGGQTLGMHAWRLRVEMLDGSPVSARTALLRFVTSLGSLACAGLGFLWQLVDREALTWHDRVAGTRVIVIPKK